MNQELETQRWSGRTTRAIQSLRSSKTQDEVDDNQDRNQPVKTNCDPLIALIYNPIRLSLYGLGQVVGLGFSVFVLLL